MHVAPLALVVLAAVTAMVDTAWHVSPGETGGSRTRPNRRAPKGKVWRTSLDADIRRQPPTLAPAGSSTPTGVTNPELGHSQSGQVTGDLVSPTVVAAAPEADEHASDTEATKEAGGEVLAADDSITDEDEASPLAEQSMSADQGKLVKKELSKEARKQNQTKFKGEESVARPPRTIAELSAIPDGDILAPGMVFLTRAEAELTLAELFEKHRKNYKL